MFASPAVLIALSATCLPVQHVPSLAPMDGVNREALYKQGITFEVFMDQAVRRRERWIENHAKGRVPEDLLERAEAVAGQWRLLVVAEDWCSDSVNTVPYLAHLVEAVDGLEMRIIDSDLGRPVMEAHPTPDGRASTPTIVLLDENYEEAGCFIERPRELQEWALENREKLDDEAFMTQKFAWYDADLGNQTMAEIVALMERAAQGSRGC